MRLIDADESLKRINDIFPRRTESDYQKGIAVGMAMAKVAIHEQPTVDAVEVVRCKDCRHRIADEDFTRGHICLLRRENGGRYCEDDDYCSYAVERSTQNEKKTS